MANAKRDENRVTTLMGITDDSNQTLTNLVVDPTTKRLKVSAVISGGGSGITSLNSQTGSSQTFANDTNVTISSSSNVHTLGWSGQLAVARGGTGAASLTGLVVGNGTSAMSTVTAPSGTVVGTTDVQTLTNKTLGSGTKTTLGSDATGDIYYRDGSGNLTRLGIGSAGQSLTVSGGLPAWGAGSVAGAQRVKVTKSTTQTISSSPVVLSFDQEEFDTDSMHDNSTNNSRITFNTAGVYLVIANANYSTNSVVAAAIRLNGTTQLSRCSNGNSNITEGIATQVLYSFAQNDYVELLFTAGSTGGNATTACHFEAFRVA